MSRTFIVTADGGSRGNPGPAAFGSVVYEGTKVLAEIGETIGIASNNVAEYSGLVAGLRAAHEIDPEANIDVRMDSKLVVEQMSGRWQIKHPDMRDLAKQARSIHPMHLITFTWIPREMNSHADRLVNKALDGEIVFNPGATGPVRINYLTERLLTDEKPTTIYLIRHGETILTPERRFSGDGDLDPELTFVGLAQAQAVAEAIALRKPEVLIASPLQRTRQTAAAVAEATGLSPLFDSTWRECGFGLWDGLSIAEVEDQFPDEYEEWLASAAYAPPGGESYAQVAVRIEESLTHLALHYSGQTVAVVTHNGVIKTAAMLAMGAPPESVFHIDIQPCSISTLLIWPSDGLRAIKSINERTHIK
ncbi:MAG: bifunctional RNase H/acid phosphatase [Actinomycetes bacterium]